VKKLLLVFLLIAAVMMCGCIQQSASYDGDYTSASHDNDYTSSSTSDDQGEDPTFYSCNWDWDGATTYAIDYSTAPSGYTYVVCTLYIQNNDTKSISTNPWNWELIANGITYDHDTMTYSDAINHNTVDIGHGGEFETQFVFLVKGGIQTAGLLYTGYGGPTMNRIHYYKTDKEIASERVQESQELVDSLFDSLVDNGHDISDIRTEEAKINNEDVSATVFVTDDMSEVESIFDMSLSAYTELESTDVYIVRVDGYDYWTPKEDIVKYKYQNPNYEKKIYVYFPHGQKVTLEKLPGEIN
jgi:hypothetical protein